MARILVVYGTTEGQTRKIARFIEAQILQRGHVVEVWDSTEKTPPEFQDTCDGIVIASSIHQGKYQASIRHYIKANLQTLERVPTAFVSVGLDGLLEGEDPEPSMLYVAEFLDETGWVPDLISRTAGALRFTEYDFLKRLLMKMISKKKGLDVDTHQDYEFTDWKQLEHFIGDFLEHAVLPYLKTLETNTAEVEPQ